MKVKRIVSSFLILLFIGSDLQGQNDVRTKNFHTTFKKIDSFPDKKNLWVFVMAGQSNMAGRGIIQAGDTLSNPRIIAMNTNGQWIEAKAPLHNYQPQVTGLDMGMSFAKELLKNVDKNVTIALVPLAMGGSSIDYWLNDKEFNGIKLSSNFKSKIRLALEKGTLKGILWHQGESDAFLEKIPNYEDNLETLFQFFRQYSQQEDLPIISGELGAFSCDSERKILWQMINEKIERVALKDPNLILVRTDDLKAKSDNIHFNAPSQRVLGIRYAKAYQHLISQNKKNGFLIPE